MSTGTLLVQGARLLDPATELDAVGDLCVRDGRIVGVGQHPPDFPAKPDATCDAANLWLLPGLVDCRARLLGGDAEAGNLLHSETRAAAAGGVTTAIIPPTRDFPLDRPGLVRNLRQAEQSADSIRILPVCSLLVRSGDALAEIGSLAEQGCVGAGNSYFIADSQILLNAMQYAHTFGLTLCATARDGSLGRGISHQGERSAHLGLPGIPRTAETLEVARWLLLAEQVGCPLHFYALSSARAVQLVEEAVARGQRVSADVPIHNLLLTDEAISDYDNSFYLMPPLRAEEDRLRLIAGVKQGLLSISSNHRPLASTLKSEVFGGGEPGAATVETLLPLGLQLVERGELELSQLVRAMTHTPAEAFGLPCGRLAVGAPADFCLLDPEESWQVSAQTLRTAGTDCIEAGQTLKGRVRQTCVGGRFQPLD